ncbi:MAG TPA: hypothetical protein VF088_08550 [Pyrinomonadaceae bacterium]
MRKPSDYNLSQLIQNVANISIIIVAALIAIVLIRNYLLPTPQKQVTTDNASKQLTANSTRSLLPGTKLSLPDVEWPHTDHTVVLALSTTCHFCTESAAFYQQLLKKRGNVPIIAVLPQAISESKKYLDQLNLHFDDTKQINLESIGIEGTPTLIVLDGNGAVIESWVGKLSDTEQSNVLRRVRESVAEN